MLKQRETFSPIYNIILCFSIKEMSGRQVAIWNSVMTSARTDNPGAQPKRNLR